MSLQPCRRSDCRHSVAKRIIGLIFGFLVPLFSYLAAQPSRAAEVVVGFRLVPPYVIEAKDGSLAGLEYELVRNVLTLTGHGMQARILPLSRLIEDFRRGRLPAFAPANPTMNLSGAFSDVLLTYNNIGLSLAARGVEASRADSLQGLRIVAFQNAHRLLPGFLDIQERNPDYLEVADQALQIRALLAGRADLVVGERRILQALLPSGNAGSDNLPALREHALFPPTYYRAVFDNPDIRDAFNRALARYRISGDYDRLLRRYENPM